MNIFSLATEQRLRIYEYAFEDATVQYTRPKNGTRARVFASTKQSLGLLTSCKAVYMEAHPLYLSLLRLVLKNTTIVDIPEYLRSTILPKIQYLEINWPTSYFENFDWAALPALRLLTIDKVGHWGEDGWYPHRQAIREYTEGSRDREIIDGVIKARRDVVVFGRIPLDKSFTVHNTFRFEFRRKHDLVCITIISGNIY